MGIRATFSGDATVIDLSRIADDMLADVIADHAAERFRAANRANRQVAGVDISYTVSVDGRVVHSGRGDLFPQNQVSTIVRSGLPARRRHTIMVDWLWHQLQPATLLRIVQAYGDIRSVGRFLSVLANPRMALFRYVLLRYLNYRYPAAMARLRVIEDNIGEVRKLYRYYRMARLAGAGGRASSEADADVLVWIARELRERSPVLTGAYRDAHTLYGDGDEIMPAGDITADADIPEAQEYSFTNPLPYARKIEIGVTQSGRDFVINASPRIYERVAEEAAALFRDVADISFEWRAEIGGIQTPQRDASRVHNQADVRYPAIVVRFA